MNVKSFGKRDYGDSAALRLPKNKTNSKPICSKPEWWFVIPARAGIQVFLWSWIPHQVRNDRFQSTIMQKKANFLGVQIGATACCRRSYENKSSPDSGENKPNQSQFQTGRLLIRRMCARMGRPIHIALEISRYIDIESGNVLFVLDEIIFVGDE
jgi:hypothetical protein